MKIDKQFTLGWCTVRREISRASSDIVEAAAMVRKWHQQHLENVRTDDHNGDGDDGGNADDVKATRADFETDSLCASGRRMHIAHSRDTQTNIELTRFSNDSIQSSQQRASELRIIGWKTLIKNFTLNLSSFL